MAEKLEIKNICKDFPGVKALDRISFSIHPGEIHGLVGENGAGKSTLIKIISGALEASSGEMTLDGKDFNPKSPRHALQAGISTIYQERSWLANRNVTFNIMLGREPAFAAGRIDFKEMRKRCRQVLEMLDSESIPLNANAEDLKAGQRQILEIARALAQKSSFLIMDEATAALNQEEQQALFTVIKNLRHSGLTILYISHRLEEIMNLADRVTVLRDGKHIKTVAVSETSRDQMINDMIGRNLTGAFPARNKPSEKPLLEIQGLCSRKAFKDVSLSLKSGEVLGITGLAGSGKEELGLALFGAFPIDSGGKIMDGKNLPHSPEKSIGHGIAYVAEDRKTEGIILTLSVKRNISLPVLKKISTVLGRILRDREDELAETWVDRLAIKTPGLNQVCENLSGGNQQKVVLAKWLASQAKVIILAHPTQEIDVGVKFELYRLIAELSGQGVGIILISGELSEILGLCHNVMVMRDGEVVAHLRADQTDGETVLRHALGQEKEAAGAV
jgi:ABC-type sugar transport system ATPase subunit